jgi:hypothetical protein
MYCGHKMLPTTVIYATVNVDICYDTKQHY